MYSHHRAHGILVLVLALVIGALPAAAQQVDPQRLAALIGKIDATALQPLGTISLPAASSDWDAAAALSPGTAGRAWTGESFSQSASGPRSITGSSINFTYEWLSADASALLMLREDSARSIAIPGGISALVANARQKLAAIGIPAEEVGRVDPRRLMAQADSTGTELLPAPRLVSHKLFIERAIAGVPVLGSRAVVTYGADRSFRKLLIQWPGLAATGHALTTDLAADRIAENVARTLIRTGEDDVQGKIPLRWVYVAIPTGEAEVRLELRVEALLLGLDTLDEVDPSTGEKMRVRLFEPEGAGELPLDADSDGIPDTEDNCPYFASSDLSDTDADGRGDPCECGDQNLDGRTTVSDLLAINLALFDPARVTDLCDADGNGKCDVQDVVAVNVDLFTPTSDTTCARQPVPGP